MADTAFEQAKRCPVCNEAGKEQSKRGRMYVFECANKRCRRFERTWVVEPRADGTIPDPDRPRMPSFPRPDQSVINHRIRKAREEALQAKEQAESTSASQGTTEIKPRGF